MSDETVIERPTRWAIVREHLVGPETWGPVMRWFAPLVITTIAAMLRLFNLGTPHSLTFDETYYVKDAWSLWLFGYEGTWGENANATWMAGDMSSLSATGSFVVHPPLGKWIIALGMALFGPASSEAWRLTTAILGAATVLVLYFVVRAMTRSIVASSIAALLLAIDGLSIVMSRIALLDGALTFFILLALLFVLRDRAQHIPRVEYADPDRPDPMYGAVFWRRPWLIAAGLTLGAAASVKWSGLYALAAFGLYVVVSDALARRRAGVGAWLTDAVLRQGPVSFLLMVPVAAVTYLASWTGWLVTAGGYDRATSDNPLAALWNYHQAIYGFHAGLTAGHPYASPAWQWPLLIRPTAVWVNSDPNCGTDHCIAVISSIPNPLLWYAGIAACLYLLYRLITAIIYRERLPWVYGVPLAGLAATYLPWLAIPGRTVFQFYTVTMMPFLVIAIVLLLREFAASGGEHRATRARRETTVVIFLAAALAMSAFFFPLWAGISVPYEYWLSHMWLPSWV